MKNLSEKRRKHEAERRAGFYPKMASSHPEFMTTPATGAFGNGDRGGRIKYN